MWPDLGAFFNTTLVTQAASDLLFSFQSSAAHRHNFPHVEEEKEINIPPARVSQLAINKPALFLPFSFSKFRRGRCSFALTDHEGCLLLLLLLRFWDAWGEASFVNTTQRSSAVKGRVPLLFPKSFFLSKPSTSCPVWLGSGAILLLLYHISLLLSLLR